MPKKPSPDDLIEQVVREVLREPHIQTATSKLRIAAVLRAAPAPLTALDILKCLSKLGTQSISSSHIGHCLRTMVALGQIHVEFIERPVLIGGMRRTPAYRMR